MKRMLLVTGILMTPEANCCWIAGRKVYFAFVHTFTCLCDINCNWT